ncbi:MAG: hypothetical protein R6U94_02765, partial [Nitriliruptoraceae bacterium]
MRHVSRWKTVTTAATTALAASALGVAAASPGQAPIQLTAEDGGSAAVVAPDNVTDDVEVEEPTDSAE